MYLRSGWAKTRNLQPGQRGCRNPSDTKMLRQGGSDEGVETGTGGLNHQGLNGPSRHVLGFFSIRVGNGGGGTGKER